MKIERAPELESLLLNLFRERSLRPRTGTHLSDLDMCLGKAFYRKTDPIPPSPATLANYLAGWAFQHELLGEDGPVEERDGIFVSVDKEIDELFVEFKWTRGTMTEESIAKPHWLRRAMGYCKVRGITTMYFAAWQQYAKEFPVATFKVTFTQEEIDSNWAEMLARKKELEEALAAGKYPENDRHETWECGYCENNVPGRCNGVRASEPERKVKIARRRTTRGGT